MERILREVQVDVVISTVGGSSILDQLVVVDAIKAVGTVKVTKARSQSDRNFFVLEPSSPMYWHQNLHGYWLMFETQSF